MLLANNIFPNKPIHKMKKYFILFFSLFLTASVFAQNGVRLIGYDALSMGRGGTSLGFFDSPELMNTNPAGISFLKNTVLGADFSIMAPKTHFQNSLNDADGDKNYFPLPSAGFVNKYKDSKLTWGIGVYTEGGMGADFMLNNALYRSQTYAYNPSDSTYYPVKGDYSKQEYHSKFAVMKGGLTASYKIFPELSFGVTAQAVYSMMQFRMPFGLNPSIMKGNPNGMPNVTFGQLFSMDPQYGGFGYSEVTALADMKDLSVVSYNGKLGLAFRPNEKFSFGINYTLPTDLKYKNGKATMDMSKQFEDAMGRAVMGFYQQPGTHGVPLDTAMKYIMMNFAAMGIDLSKGMYAEYDLEVDMKLPQTIGFGIAYNPTNKLRFGFDFEWINWKNAFDKMAIKLTNGNNANVNKMMGGTDINIDFPLNWKDAVILKAGGEFDASNKVTLRLGYVYGSNPVPSSTVFPVFPAIVEHHLTVGGTYKFSDRFNLNLALETALNGKLTASNPSLLQSEFSNGTSELSTILGHISFNWNF